MNTTALRKLSRLSVLKFGKYYDITIQNLINYRNVKAYTYLTWVYYALAQISFLDDILDELGILPENRIDKPGKITNKKELDKYTYLAVQERLRLDEELGTDRTLTKLMNAKLSISETKRRLKQSEIFDNTLYSKQNMKKKNTGKDGRHITYK